MMRRCVAVDDLVPGLYVAELDRPWLETPFLFQGFVVEDEAALRTLREYCRHVYVDPERSRPEALRRVPPAASPPPARVTRLRGAPRVVEPGHADVVRAFGEAPQPSGNEFRALLRLARDVRGRSRRIVDRIFRDVRLGRSVDTAEVREIMRDLVAVVTENASASLWLTNLRKRDEYTSIHSMNVCVLALAFGRHLGLRRHDLEELGTGAILHDVGKVRTPDEILNKQERLTEAEMAIVRRHPEDGYRLLQPTGALPEAALQIVRLHHERIDGSGYPLGLAGEQIPQPVLIAGICDVYDAMTSDRPYRKGVPADRVLRMLYDRAEFDFGQALTEGFIRCLGIYPPGCLVQLDDNALAVVVTADPHARLRPVVMLVRDAEGALCRRRTLRNLAAMAAESDRPGRGCNVRRVLNPADHDVDIAAVLAADLATR
ncbi:metal-dependent phosphohydrolase [Spiribacter halobius]|uniref:Metal-dependent phosphohydrolase n=1 Tax=Sediminicurvatus halobius TaxID=2182432 RepID=A0A2U2N7Q1_9GAMM|nr:metal-dependent phosphohydrolase [Spiribacter halobius]